MFAELLKERLGGLIAPAKEQVAVMEAHYELLVRWNRVLNLTSIRDVGEAVERHYCESLFLAAHLPLGPLQIVDIGSGAGFPGFPVAVVRPECSVVLVESHQRKAVFLREACRKLPNVTVLSKRAKEVQGNFDTAISRAVSYEDLSEVLGNLARSVELLTGGEGPPEGLGFRWEDPIPLPWGRQRFLRRGARLE